MIIVNKVSFGYVKNNVLNEISLSIEKNSILGLIGVNGSGKTTLLKIILQILQPKSGYIENHFKRKIGVVMEELGMFPDMTVEKNLKISATIKGIDFSEIDNVLKIVRLEDKKKSKVKTLSSGQKQRLSIASALLGNPELLILDEPINGLDPIGIFEIREIISIIAKEGKTILIASHILSELEKICTHIAIINNGCILASGTIDQVIDKYDNLEMAFVNYNKL
jgi:ABC-type multidrug transport system ATPase subunit